MDLYDLRYPQMITLPSLIFSLFLFLYVSFKISRNFNTRRKITLPPEAGGAWPIIGHLHLLSGQKPRHITLGDMADKYGPIFTVKLGVRRALVVSSWEIAKECFTTNDKIFANRPKLLAPEVLGYNYANVGFSPYGPHWRRVRKMATLQVLSNRRLEMLKHIRESEVKASMKGIYESWVEKKKYGNVLVDMKRWFGDIVLNTVFRMVVGKRFIGEFHHYKNDNEENGLVKLFMEFFELSGVFSVADAFPILRWFDIDGYEKEMRKTVKELDYVFEKWIKEHKERTFSGAVRDEHDHDFMDVMLSALAQDADHEIAGYDDQTTVKATCLALVLAGTDTTLITLVWALSLLLNNREVLKKVQNELDEQVGRERQVNDSDMKNLIYLQAIVKETLRLYPAAPLLLTHESMEDCSVGGYQIPVGTLLSVNLRKIQRDSRVWTNPNEFYPERFLTNQKDFDVRGQNFEFIPFGSGRRMCPGISMATQLLQLTLATLLHGFDMVTPFDEPVDMDERGGLTIYKETPLMVLISPRLPAHLYN